MLDDSERTLDPADQWRVLMIDNGFREWVTPTELRCPVFTGLTNGGGETNGSCLELLEFGEGGKVRCQGGHARRQIAQAIADEQNAEIDELESRAGLSGANAPDDSLEFAPLMSFGQEHGPPFPLEVLPPWIREFSVAVAEFTQTPPDMAAMLSLAAVATACASKWEAHPTRGWVEPLNIYVVVALPPGNRKSPVFAKCAAPIYEYQDDENTALFDQILDEKADRKVLEGRIKRAYTGATKDDPDALADYKELQKELAEAEKNATHAIELTCSDITPERLVSKMEQTGGRIAAWSDEGAEFFESFGRYQGSGRANVDVYLKAWSRGRLEQDRQTRDRVVVPKAYLTMGVTVQPSTVSSLTSVTAEGRGIMGRILFSFPRSIVGEREGETESIPDAPVQAYRNGLRALLDARVSGDLLEFTDEAWALILARSRELEPDLGKLGKYGGEFCEWASKLIGEIVRLAALIHLADHAGAYVAAVPPVSAQAAQAALRLGEYLLPHAELAFRMGAASVDQAERKVWRWIERRHAESGDWAWREQSVWQGVKGGVVNNTQVFRDALEGLQKRGLIAKSSAEGGPGGARWSANPLAFRGTPK